MKNILAAAIVVLSLGASVNALDINNKLEVGAGIFDSIIMSKDFRHDDKSSLGAGIYGDYKLGDSFTAGLEFSNVFGYAGKGIYKGSNVVDTSIGLRGKYLKPMDFGSRKGDVYGIVGVANHNMSAGSTYSFNENDIGFSFGGGVDLQLTPKLLAGFELRYHVVRGGGGYGMNTLAPLLKVGYCF